ncbi:hypothetical protein B566_EDAN011365 [Ephemera danica]|nr:hypothetical protein B566_EDAN011365 [Ephemera danica]
MRFVYVDVVINLIVFYEDVLNFHDSFAMDFHQVRTEEEFNSVEADVESVEQLLSSIEIAECQVATSSDKTIQEINAAFDSLSNALLSAVEKRKQALISEVLNAKEKGLLSLKPYRDILQSKLDPKEGANTSQNQSEKKQIRFSDRTPLPRIPRREEVPHISAQLPGRGLKARLCSEIMAAGKVSQRGPVQLTEIEPEHPVDLSQFRLQRAYGDACADPQLETNFFDVYRGPEPSFLVKELAPGQPYTFRVCCRAEGDQEWSAWSLPQVAKTSQQPFCWDNTNSNYQVTNENKIAAKVTNEPSILFSKGAQFGPGHSVEFTVLEAKEGLSDEGLGLAVRRQQGDSLLQPGVLFLSAQGCVFVDGSAKTTRLPPLVQGSKVTFTCEHIRDDRLRVHIDSDNKTVTYDWRVHGQPLLFVLGFGQVGWKVLVE